jgi:RimJ/RimL family protein N-acetyltransferase
MTDLFSMKLKKNAINQMKKLRGKFITGKITKLREKKLSDVRDDYRWQSDPELAELDAAPILVTSFSIYLLDYTSVLHRQSNQRFPLAIETLDGKHIGNCTFYDIDDNKSEAQMGIMIGIRDYWNKGYGTDAVNTMITHFFNTTSLQRIYLKTLDWNHRAQKCFTRCGFIQYGQLKRDGHKFLLMEIKREQWQKLHNDGVK